MKKLTLKEQITAHSLTIKKQEREIKRLTKVVQNTMSSTIDIAEDAALNKEIAEERQIECDTMKEAFRILAQEIITANKDM